MTTILIDPRTKTFQVENEKVVGVPCEIVPVETICQKMGRTLQAGDYYWRVLALTFFDEEESAGRHSITVNALREGVPVPGATVHHGWPYHTFPQVEGEDKKTILGQLVEFTMGAHGYRPAIGSTEMDAYWVCMDGHASELVHGMGMPYNRHVCYAIVFDLAEYQPDVVEPGEPSPEIVRGELQAIYLLGLRLPTPAIDAEIVP
jgi:hypothetical protein